jgi:hypothetical protein
MFGVIAALAAAAQQPKPVDDPDFHCMVAISMVLGRMAESPAASAEDKAGVTAVFMYYVGKIDARFPGLDYAGQMSALLARPGYLASELQPDIARCGQEATTRGETLEEMGKALQQSAPLGETRPG